jgi:hypothetical protein
VGVSLKKNRTIRVVWLAAALLLSAMNLYSAYYLNPEGSIPFVYGMIALTFPAGLFVATAAQLLLLLFGIREFSLIGGIIFDALIILSGYLQWFTLLPLIKNKFQSKP